MDDKNKTKDQLIRELAELRRRFFEMTSNGAQQTLEAEFPAEKERGVRKGQWQLRLLAHALENCPLPVVLAYPDGRIMTYNAAFNELTGCSKEDMQRGKSLNDLAPKALQSIMTEALKRSRHSKGPQQFETEIVRKGGGRVFAEASAHAFYDSAGNIQHVCCFLSDVDARKHLEKRVLEIERQLRVFVESNPIETTVVDTEGRVVFSNLTKTRSGEKIQNAGARMFEDRAGNVEAQLHRDLMRCIKSGIPEQIPERKCGERFLHTRITPFSSGAIITSVDLTKLKRMASELEENKERIRVLGDFAKYWESWIGKNGEHVYVSPSCEEATGYRPEDFQSDPKLFKTLVHPDDRALIDVHLGDDFETPEPKCLDFRILKPGGEERWILHYCRPVYNADGRFIGRRASNRDFTDSKEIENQLKLRTAELHQATHELSQYVTVFSGDLRAPLRAIRNYTDFLCEELGESVGNVEKRYLDGLVRATVEADGMLEDLFEFSQIGGRDDTFETVQVGPFLKDLIATLHVPPEVKLILADEWPTIEAQPKLLRYIFRNLIDNALKFNRSSQKLVEIGWRETEGECYEFHVRDNGIGIRPRHADRIFGVFERLHTLEEYDGNGMGLAIVKKATVKLGGSVRLISKPTEGSTFFVTLPQKQNPTR